MWVGRRSEVMSVVSDNEILFFVTLNGETPARNTPEMHKIT
jgi:hypothetical protein